MTSPKLSLFEKAISYLLLLLLTCITINLNAQQCTTYNFVPSCTTTVANYDDCTTWANGCGAGWTRSHGTPEILSQPGGGETGGGTTYYALMVANSEFSNGNMTSNESEGMFTSYSFVAGQYYTISINLAVSGNAGAAFYIYAANGLTQGPLDDCQDPVQINSSKQLIGKVSGSNSGYTTYTFTFFSGTNYSQLWMYADLSKPAGVSPTAYEQTFAITSTVSSIQVCPACNTVTTGLTTSNNGTTLNWNAVAAAGYLITVNDNHSGTITTSNLSSSTNSVSYCPKFAGDNVSFFVQVICSNGGVGPASSTYSYTFSPITLSAPINLSYLYNTNPAAIALSWTAVTNATGYCVLLQDITAGGGIQACAAYPTTNGASANDLHLLNGHTYKAAVIAFGGCVSSPQSAWFTFVAGPCSTPYVSNVEVLGGGTVNVAWGLVSGASSYNIEFVNGSYTKLFSNFIPATNPNNGINFSGIPAGTYRVAVQCNCSSNVESPWGTYFLSVQVSAVKNPQQLLSGQTTDDASSSDTKLSIYPVPSSSQVNVLYNASANGKADIIIMNALGSVVSHKTIGITAGTNNYQINVSEFANGVYIIKLVDGVNIHVQKLMVVK